MSLDRAIVISDCHGQPHLIENALGHSNYDIESDHLIFAGDFVDIGDHAKKCLELLIENQAELLWGNHDVARLLGRRIWPQNYHDQHLYELLLKHRRKFHVATHFDNILITHAGLSNSMYDRLKIKNNSDIQEVVSILNSSDLVDTYNQKDGILWYRPNPYSLWNTNFVQVSGHTPPEWLEKTMDYEPTLDFYTIDPYSMTKFEEDRFRYAEIRNGNIKIIDSNEI